MESARGVLVTGGTSGIGLAAAAEFALHGDSVVIGGRRPEALSRAIHSVRERIPDAKVEGVEIDVRETSSVDAGVRKAADLMGSIDVLVNSAGIFPRLSLMDITDEIWMDVIDTNLSGVFRSCRAVVPFMVERGAGSIVNIGSIWAQHTWPNRSAYAASKAAVEQFTRCLALELAPGGIRVNAVSPGIMRTAMTEGVLQSDAFVNEFMPRVTTGRVGEPETELAGLIRFLTLDSAAYMSGEVVTVYGGFH